MQSVNPEVSAPRTELEQAILDSLDRLLHALTLEPLGDDHFRVASEPGRFARVFGGQTIAQAFLAACATVEGKDAHSIHAYFVDAGAPEEPLEITVDRVRDGRSMATRRATVMQHGRPLLVALASFHTNVAEPELADPAPAVSPPGELPRLQDWVDNLPPEMQLNGRNWVDQPPPLEMRIGEPPTFLGGTRAPGTRAHWMRLPRPVGDDTMLHAGLLTYASDYLLLDMAFRSHPDDLRFPNVTATSLDHAVWLHRPVRFDRWHVHVQETLVITGHRGLVRGAIYDEGGHLVATVMQEVLVRPAR
jgi:acyl-CoA thioesterase-2